MAKKVKKLEGQSAEEYFKSIFGDDYGSQYVKASASEVDLSLYEYYMKVFADEDYVSKLVEGINKEKNKAKKRAMIQGFIRLAEIPYETHLPDGGDILLVEITPDLLLTFGTNDVEGSQIKLSDNRGKETLWTVVKKDGRYYLARVIKPEDEQVYNRLQFDVVELE